MEISQVILSAVDLFNKCFEGFVNVEIIDTQMSRKYPDRFVPIGYLGITILVDSCVEKHRTFLKYQFAEDMLFGMTNPEKIAEGYIFDIIRNDLPKLELKHKIQKRKLKLQQLNEIII